MSMQDRPEALDELLGAMTAALPDEDGDADPVTSPAKVIADLEQQSTERARALLARVEAKAREAAAEAHAKLKAAARTEAAAEIRADAALRNAEGELVLASYGRELADLITPSTETDRPEIVRLVDHARAVEPNPPADLQAAPGIERIPMSRTVRYAVRGMADVPDEYNETRTIRPRELTLTYRDGQDPHLGGVHAYVKGWWMEDGARVHAESVGRHFYGDMTAWPKELADEARRHDPSPS